MQRDIDRPRYAFFHAPANMKGIVLDQADEAALEAEETGGAHGRCPHELVELYGRTQFKRNFKDFMQFVGRGAAHAVECGVGDGDCAEPSQSGDQGFVFLSKRLREARVDENCAMRARGTKGSRDENSGRRVGSKMRGAVDTDGNAFARGHGARRDLKRRAQVILLKSRAYAERELRGFGRNRLQLKYFFLLGLLLLKKNQH